MTQNKLKVIIILAITVLIWGCNLFKKEVPKATPYPGWVNSGVLYEINTRQYSPKGTFRDIEADLPRIKALGVDILWFMPIYPIGEKDRKVPKGAKTSLGSYYSIQDYREINPEFGTAQDFKSLVIKAHESGLKVIIDWVANHTARDHD
jgi:glycosidase